MEECRTSRRPGGRRPQPLQLPGARAPTAEESRGRGSALRLAEVPWRPQRYPGARRERGGGLGRREARPPARLRPTWPILGIQSRQSCEVKAGEGAVPRGRLWHIKRPGPCAASPRPALWGPCPVSRSHLSSPSSPLRAAPCASPGAPSAMARKLGGRKTIVILGLVGLLCTVLGGVMIFVMPQLIRDQILQGHRRFTAGRRP
ncbi:uncharacterized protein LOC114036806 [Vombatus ursinus]|uniref:uncharacterized protein LOC114036806 n=1 Tax=Vombatus ursinus TaxID=29139 RepID=UPI000FFD09C2|nr:uncharacterized protein LOC114036806 [Vombatus ursinus]